MKGDFMRGIYLKPCPFCGNTTAVAIVDDSDEVDALDTPQYTVCCCVNEMSPVPANDWQTGCGATAGWARTQSDAAEKWNRRNG